MVDAGSLPWRTDYLIHAVGMAPSPVSSLDVLAPQRVGQPRETGDGMDHEGVVSLTAVVPEALLASMRSFIERHPNWDQYRLVQAALAGFLVQNGLESRAVTRYYLANLFPGQSSFQDPNNC